MADVTYCPHCGTPAAGAAARCATCGAALHQASPPTLPAYPGYAAPPYYSAPGYPAQPQGALPTGPYPYAYPWTYPYPYSPISPQRPRRAPGETYALVVSWIVTVAGGLSILCGLFLGLISL